jgi:hypothetical protein
VLLATEVSLYDVVVDAPIRVPLRIMLYPATPTSSVAAFHDSPTAEEVVEVAAKFVGAVGAVVSS